MTGAKPETSGWVALALAGAVLLIPVLIAPVPPVTDYPNHLARMWLLSDGTDAASVSRFYRLQFDTFTNVGIDLVALTLGRLAGYSVAGHAAIAAAIVLPALGGALLWRSVWGRFHWWMAGFGLLVWGQNLLDGFLNFQIAIGLALLFAAWEPRVQTQRPVAQVALRTVLSLVLLLTHPFGLLFYGMLMIGLILGPTLDLRSRRYRRSVAYRSGLAAIGLVLMTLVFIVAVPRLPGAQEHSGLGTIGAEIGKGMMAFAADPKAKLLNVLFALRAYSNPADMLTAACLGAPIVLAASMRCLRVHAGLMLLGAGLLLAYLLCPDYLLGAYWVDARFAVMLPFVAAAAAMPALPPLPGRVAAGLLVVALLGRTGMIGMIWRDRQADVAAVASALEAVPAGAAVLPVEQRPADRARAPAGRFTIVGENSFRHLAALAVPWRHAFVPTLFAARGKQPIAVVPPYDEIAEPNGSQLADVHALDTDPPGNTGAALAPYVTSWRTRFDFVLVLNADMPDRLGPFYPSPDLSLVRDAGFAKLFRVEPMVSSAAVPARPGHGGPSCGALVR